MNGHNVITLDGVARCKRCAGDIRHISQMSCGDCCVGLVCTMPEKFFRERGIGSGIVVKALSPDIVEVSLAADGWEKNVFVKIERVVDRLG